MIARLETYTMGSMEIDGRDFPVEVDFEWWEGKPAINFVSALKIETQPGGLWYDENGMVHVATSRRVKRLDVTEFVSLEEWAEEITAYYEYLTADKAT
jgi:hypothetical protein